MFSYISRCFKGEPSVSSAAAPGPHPHVSPDAGPPSPPPQASSDAISLDRRYAERARAQAGLPAVDRMRLSVLEQVADRIDAENGVNADRSALRRLPRDLTDRIFAPVDARVVVPRFQRGVHPARHAIYNLPTTDLRYAHEQVERTIAQGDLRGFTRLGEGDTYVRRNAQGRIAASLQLRPESVRDARPGISAVPEAGAEPLGGRQRTGRIRMETHVSPEASGREFDGFVASYKAGKTWNSPHVNSVAQMSRVTRDLLLRGATMVFSHAIQQWVLVTPDSHSVVSRPAPGLVRRFSDCY